MHRAGRIIVFVAAAFALLSVVAASAEPLGVIPFIGYGASLDGSGGYEYVRFPPYVALAPLATNLVAGTFVNGDYSAEYALDANQGFVSVSTNTGAVTLIGPFMGFFGARVSMSANSSGQIYAIVGDDACSSTSFYTIDRVTGASTLIGGWPRCIQSIAFDENDLIYGLDRTTGDVVYFDTGGGTVLGPLGITIDGTSSIAIDPVMHLLYLVQFEGGTNMLYQVNESTGAAGLVGVLGGDQPISALALAPQRPDDIFANGFE